MGVVLKAIKTLSLTEIQVAVKNGASLPPHPFLVREVVAVFRFLQLQHLSAFIF